MSQQQFNPLHQGQGQGQRPPMRPQGPQSQFLGQQGQRMPQQSMYGGNNAGQAGQAGMRPQQGQVPPTQMRPGMVRSPMMMPQQQQNNQFQQFQQVRCFGRNSEIKNSFIKYYFRSKIKISNLSLLKKIYGISSLFGLLSFAFCFSILVTPGATAAAISPPKCHNPIHSSSK